jgi:hypothetical protein
MLENIAFPTPGFSDAPMIAIECGARKLIFDGMGLKEEEDVEDKEDGEELPVTNGIEKLCNGTYKCLYTQLILWKIKESLLI